MIPGRVKITASLEQTFRGVTMGEFLTMTVVTIGCPWCINFSSQLFITFGPRYGWSMLSRHLWICLDSCFPTGQAAWRRKGSPDFHQWMCDVLRKVVLQDVPISSHQDLWHQLTQNHWANTLMSMLANPWSKAADLRGCLVSARKKRVWSMLIFKHTHTLLMEKI